MFSTEPCSISCAGKSYTCEELKLQNQGENSKTKFVLFLNDSGCHHSACMVFSGEVFGFSVPIVISLLLDFRSW